MLSANDLGLTFGMEMLNGLRFTAKSNLSGAPVPGIGPGNRGILPEPYHAAAEKAVYAVYHYETPILWQVEDGTWEVPSHRYSNRTTVVRNKIWNALNSAGVTPTLI